MSLEEKASRLRDRFNFLVKQYKKYEKKKITGNDNIIEEREEIKNLLSLFFKEYGSFIRTRKNSFGTFDYESYLLHLRKEESIYNSKTLNPSKSNPIVDNYGELYRNYNEDRQFIKLDERNYNEDRQFMKLDERTYSPVDDNNYTNGRNYTDDFIFTPHEDFIRSNKIEYKRPYPIDYPMRHHHTDFVSGYYKSSNSTIPRSPSMISPNLYNTPLETTNSNQSNFKQSNFSNFNQSNFSNFNQNNFSNFNQNNFSNFNQSGFYEQYVKKKVTVYDFIKNNEKAKSNDKTLYRSPNQNNVINPQLHPQVNNIYNTNPPFISPQQPFTNNYSTSTPYNLHNSNFSSHNSNFNSHNSNFNSPNLNFSSHNQFSPEFRSFKPPQHNNTPLWKNKFAHMDTAKLQGRVAPQHNFIRSSTYNTVKVKPSKKSDLNKKMDLNKKTDHNKKMKIEYQSPNVLSSSTSEDYQKYFLEDLLKETGKEDKMAQNVTEFLYEFCDNFFEHLLLMSCALSSNGRKKNVCSKDVKMILNTEFDIKLPEDSSNVL